MKKSIYCTLLFVIVTTLAYAQAHRDAVPEEDGLDIVSIAIGVVIGAIVGYLIGARSNKK